MGFALPQSLTLSEHWVVIVLPIASSLIDRLSLRVASSDRPTVLGRDELFLLLLQLEEDVAHDILLFRGKCPQQPTHEERADDERPSGGTIVTIVGATDEILAVVEYGPTPSALNILSRGSHDDREPINRQGSGQGHRESAIVELGRISLSYLSALLGVVEHYLLTCGVVIVNDSLMMEERGNSQSCTGW
jgi:hypothetical protein